jgi:hypothetical protein
MYDAGTRISVLRRPEFLELVRKHRPWLTRKEAAAYIGVSVRTLEVWHASGTGPPCHKSKGSGLMRYHIDALDDYVRGRDPPDT